MLEKKIEQLSYYCNRGWSIFPLVWMDDGDCSCGSSECKSPGKHPLVKGGFLSASTDLQQVITWYERWPKANWGLRTGDQAKGGAGILVVDIDSKNHGFDTWEMLSMDHQGHIETVTVETGNNGQHLWFSYPSDIDLRSTAGALGPGLDVRANGGYVVVPPSQTNRPYRFELNPEETPISTPPDWLIKELIGHKSHLPSIKAPAAIRIGDQVPQGERHQALLAVAGSLRRIGMGNQEIEAALQTIRDERFSTGDHPITNVEIGDIASWITTKSREYALTDLGNAERFIDQHQEDVRFCYEWDKWLIWNGRRWVEGDQASLTRRAHATVRSIYQEAANTIDEKRRVEIAKHAARSEATARVESMLQSAKPYLVVLPDELNQHPIFLNVANGVIDLGTGELLPHNRDLKLTKFIDVPYYPNTAYPEWEKFLDLVTGGDDELKLFLQVAVGYTFTGRTDEHSLFFLYGVGQNGKTTFTETIRRLMSDYAKRVDIEALMQSFGHGQAATPYVASMAGARLVLSSEIPESRKLNEPLVKDLSGGDTITARYLFANPFTFEPTHKLWLYGNYKPRISGTDEGIWRRIRVIPFKVTIPNDTRRPMHEVISSFETEMPGILAWAVTGSLIWQTYGLHLVDAVKDATSEYRSEQDLVQQFLEERCVMRADYTVKKDPLYEAWRAWCDDAGEKDALRKSKKWLTTQMTRRGFEHGGGGKRSLVGLKLKN